MKIFIILLFAILLLALILVISLNYIVNEWKVKDYKKQIKFNNDDRIMYILAHPDDEVLLSGTMSVLKRKYNLKIKALYLTHGEDGPTNNLCDKKDLKAFRTVELSHVKEALSIDEMVIKDYPDRYLNKEDYNEVLKNAEEEIKKFNPTYLFSFDTSIGMYGHTDHVVAGKVAYDSFTSSNQIKGLFQMTLPKGMLNIALKISKTFKERYNKEFGLPSANIKFNFYKYRKYRFNDTKCHKTQAQVMYEMQPYYDKLPRFIYYSIFSHEYFNYIGK